MNMKNRYYVIPSLAVLTSCLIFGAVGQAAAANADGKPAAATIRNAMKLSVQEAARQRSNAQQKAIMEKKRTPEQERAVKEFEKKINQVHQGLVWKKKFDEADAALAELLKEKEAAEPYLRSKIAFVMADSAWRQNDMEKTVKVIDRLFKEYAAVLTPADKASLYRTKSNALLNLKRHEEKAQALYDLLGCALSDKLADGACKELIRAMWDLGKKAEALALAKEYAAMADAESAAARTAFYLVYVRYIKDEALALQVLDQFKAAEKDLNKQAAETLNVAAAFRGKEKIAEQLPPIITGAAYSFKNRVRALSEYAFAPAVKKNPGIITELAEEHLLKVKDAPVQDYGQLLHNLIRHSAEAMKSPDLSGAYCSKLLATPGIANHFMVDASKRLVIALAQRGEFAEAVKLVEKGFQAKDLNVPHFVYLCKLYADILKWQSKGAEAEKFLRSKITPENKTQLCKVIADLHIFYREWDKAYAAFMEAGDTAAAVRVYHELQPEKSRALALKVLQDEKNQPENVRGAMLYHFLEAGAEDVQIRQKYAELMKYVSNYDLRRALSSAVTANDTPRALEFLDLMIARNNGRITDPNFTRMLVEIYIKTGNTAKLQEVKKQILESKHKNYELFVVAIDCFTAIRQDKAGAFAAYCKTMKFPEGMTQKGKADLLLNLSAYALNAKMFTVSEEIHQTYLALFKPEPCKTYTVPFSDEPVLGVHGFLSLKKMPEPQFMDRKYGGNMDFLVTDVATGDRGAAITSKSNKEAYKPSEVRMICDKYGLHMMFEAFDSKAKEIEAGLASAGSFEMYFAPGDNQPYYCPLPDMNNKAVSIWNSSYNNPNWRQLDVHGKTNFDIKTEKVYTAQGYIVYMFIAWDKFYDKLPEKGDTWDFENVHWSRFGGNSWNGLKTIHGRSTWGKLVFDISDAQMRQIKRLLIVKARQAYLKEKRTTGSYHGAIDRWQNDVYSGCPAFYSEKVAPLIKKLDSYLPLVSADMDDATVDKLFLEAVPGWNEIRFKIAELRGEYLEDALFE